MVRYTFVWNHYLGGNEREDGTIVPVRTNEEVDQMLRDNYDFTYCIYGREIGPQHGIPHLQGYCENPHTIPKKTLKTVPGPSFRIANGMATSNVAYIRGEGAHEGKPGIDKSTVVEWGNSAAHTRVDKKDAEGIKSILSDIETSKLQWREFVLKYPVEARDKMAFWKDAIIQFRAPINFVVYHSLKDYKYPILDLTKVNYLIGPSQSGKTSFAMAHFKHPLIIKNMESFKFFREGYHDGFIFDDFGWLLQPFDVCRQLLDIDQPLLLRLLYGPIEIPKGIPRIITGNTDAFLRGDLLVIRERIVYHQVTRSILFAAVSPSPTPHAQLKRSHAVAFPNPLSKTQEIPRPVSPVRTYPHDHAVDHDENKRSYDRSVHEDEIRDYSTSLTYADLHAIPITDEVLSDSDTEEYDDEMSD